MKATALALVAIIACSVAPAFGAQLRWDASTLDGAFYPTFTFQRTISIDYVDGGQIAEELRGRQESVHLLADSDTPGMQDLIEKINRNLADAGSTVVVTDLNVQYAADLVGRQDSATIDYKVIMVPKITGFLIREYKANSPALLDVSWRGLSVDGPAVLSDGEKQVEINTPISFFQEMTPKTFQIIQGTGAEELLRSPLIDASGINLAMSRWHSLFDPTGIVSDASRFGISDKTIVTTFSMGESTIITPSTDKRAEASVSSLDTKYKIVALESADSANIAVPGYATSDVSGGSEVIGTSPNPPPGTTINPTGQFPVIVIYGMAGMAAAGAGGFFWWSGKKAKKEMSLGQSGIDPVHLRGVETSDASGGYKTNRGEAHLIGEKNTKTMPKGWTDKPLGQ